MAAAVASAFCAARMAFSHSIGTTGLCDPWLALRLPGAAVGLGIDTIAGSRSKLQLRPPFALSSARPCSDGEPTALLLPRSRDWPVWTAGRLPFDGSTGACGSISLSYGEIILVPRPAPPPVPPCTPCRAAVYHRWPAHPRLSGFFIRSTCVDLLAFCPTHAVSYDPALGPKAIRLKRRRCVGRLLRSSSCCLASLRSNTSGPTSACCSSEPTLWAGTPRQWLVHLLHSPVILHA